jgi:hypothetical protein
MTSSEFPRHRSRPVRREAAKHLFTVGQAVRLRSGFRGPFPFTGICHVTGTLPPIGGSPQYRIRSDCEHCERVTTQDALQAVPLPSGESATLIEGTFGHGRGIEAQQPQGRSREAEAGKASAQA